MICFGIGAALSSVAPVPRASAQEVPPASLEGPAHSRFAPPPGVSFPPAPPPNFNPLAASEIELQSFGFPPRPDAVKNPEAYARWSKMVTASKTRIDPVLKQTNVHHGSARNLGAGKLAKPALLNDKPVAPIGNGATATNWSGGADYYPSTAPFLSANSFVYGEWVVPIAQQAFGVCTGGWVYSAHWVGFDGFNTNDVLQAGSEANAYCNGSTTASEYYLWYEWAPNPETAISRAVNPGDVVAVEVWVINSTTGGAYWVNYTTNQATTIAFTIPLGSTYTGTSMEWIVEAPTVGGSQSTLMNYTAVPWNYAYGYSATTGLIYEPSYAPGSGGTAYVIDMINAQNAVISQCLSYQYVDMMWCFPEGPAL
jgi:hypothetical protein